MAFDASQARRMRTAIVVVALLAVAIVAVVVVLGFVRPAAQTDATGTVAAASGTDADASSDASGADASDADAADALETVDAQYGTATNRLLTQYQADPSNPSALLDLANGYFDWGVAALNHATTTEGHSHATDLLTDAIGYYDTYLAENPGAKSVTVDRAICLFYTGDTAGAIAALEDLVTNEDAAFAPAWANLGMFYEAEDRTADAERAYEQAIEAAGDDDAYNVKDYAQGRLDALHQED